MKLADRVTIVTGAASGIGQATARLFAAEGAAVVLADVDGPACAAETAILQVAGGRALAVPCDVSREDDVARLFAAAGDAFGRVDVLVNAAGVGLAGTIADGTADEWWHLLGVNLAGTFLCCREAVRVMRRQGGGSIVNVASELALVGAAEIAAYAATKGGVLQLTRAMAADHTREGIRVNAVCPGPVDTPLLDGLIAAADDPEAERRATEESTLLGRLGRPDEIARAILFLAGDDSSFVVGAALVADGGVTAV
jgi:meso-butanediol dehydrogenase / (S,S)-butanediol dehydrogenase / diacetyl reductase